MNIPNDRDLLSLGCLSQRYQQSPRTIKAMLESIDVEPSLALNGLPYFAITDETDRQLRQLCAELRETQRANDALPPAKWTAELPVPEGYKLPESNK